MSLFASLRTSGSRSEPRSRDPFDQVELRYLDLVGKVEGLSHQLRPACQLFGQQHVRRGAVFDVEVTREGVQRMIKCWRKQKHIGFWDLGDI